jgi:opacity protein-like surface antigen
MSSRKTALGISAAALIAGLSMAPVLAQAENLYVGLGVGDTRLKDNASCSDLSAILDPGYSCSSDTADSGRKAFIGYQIGKSVAVELAYVNFGEYDMSASGAITGFPATGNSETKIKGYNLSLLANFPVNEKFSFLARAGVFRWDYKTSATVSAMGLTEGDSESATGTDLASGLGVQYDFSNTLGVRAEWQRFMDVGNPDITGKTDIDLTSLSFVFKF